MSADWTWQGHERAQILAVATTTPSQRLTWLQDTIDFLQRLGRLPTTAEPVIDPPARR